MTVFSWYDGALHDLANPCNAACHCTTLNYEPVCDFSTGLQYFSSCHAGCTDHYREGRDKMFTNCSCLSVNRFYNSSYSDMHTTPPPQFYTTTMTTLPAMTTTFDYASYVNRSITSGRCSKDKQCSLFYIFAPFFFIMVFSIFIKIVPLLNVTLR